MDNFEIATRKKYRFPFKGLISTEDCYDLPVESLDTIFKKLNSERKRVNEESLLDVKSDQDKELDIKIAIIKHIVSVKLEEENVKMKRLERKEQKQKIMEILSKKKDADLENKSIEELNAMLDADD